MDTTVNNSVYRKARKKFLEHNGKLKCSLCKYHLGDNSDYKYYGTTRSWTGNDKIRFPSWKLVSKNKKQWESKPSSFKIIEKRDYNSNFKYSYVEIKF